MRRMIFAIGIVLALSFPMGAFCQNICDVTGTIRGITPGTSGLVYKIRFSVEVEDMPFLGTLYLGCSYSSDGREYDLAPQSVSSITRQRSWTISGIPTRADAVAFALWERKITSAMVRDMGGSEEYRQVMRPDDEAVFTDRSRRLRDDGYFMLGRLDSTWWIDLDTDYTEAQLLGATIHF